jgi:hypothetical protein
LFVPMVLTVINASEHEYYSNIASRSVQWRTEHVTRHTTYQKLQRTFRNASICFFKTVVVDSDDAPHHSLRSVRVDPSGGCG